MSTQPTPTAPAVHPEDTIQRFDVFPDSNATGSFIVSRDYRADGDLCCHEDAAAVIAALRERLEKAERMLDSLIDAHYGGSFHHIGDGDGIPKEEADELREWSNTYRVKGEQP